MIRIAALALAALALLSACGVDGEPIKPSRAAHAGPVAGF